MPKQNVEIIKELLGRFPRRHCERLAQLFELEEHLDAVTGQLEGSLLLPVVKALVRMEVEDTFSEWDGYQYADMWTQMKNHLRAK